MALAMATNNDLLNRQADRIESVLASHRVPARVQGGTVSPRWVRFNITPALGARIATVRNLSEELALALGAQDVRVARAGEELTVEMPRVDAEPVRLLSLLRSVSSIPPLTACLGVAEDGRPLLLRLPSPDVAHVLVAGTTGSGKTELMRTLILSLALTNRQSKLQIALIDPKRRGFAPLAGLPHVINDVASSREAIGALLFKLTSEMERRDHDGISSPHIVIVVDELLDVLAMEGLAGGGRGTGKDIEAALTRIAQRGREAGLHLVAGAQKPSAAVIGPMLKANFPTRLVGRVGSSEDARVATGLSGSGAEKLLGRGDFLAVAAGQTVRFQAAWTSAQDWNLIISRI
jgi:DNA segregation ATPase FtsK/SpoIIIE, S-DNA-T family